MAQGASPLDIRLSAFEAAKRTLRRLRELTAAGASFGFETTLAGRAQFSVLGECRRAGFSVHLYYLWLPAPDVLPERIRHRVLDGGHDVPRADVARRFGRSAAQLRAYAEAAEAFLVFDAQPAVPELIWRRNGTETVLAPARAAAMKKGLGL